MLTAGEVVGLIVAVFWAILVSFLAYVLVKLARLLTETTKMVSDLGERAAPLLDDMTMTVAETNRQLVQVDAIAHNVKGVTATMAGLTGLVSAVATGPLVKLAAFVHGVREALAGRRVPEVRRVRVRAVPEPRIPAGRRAIAAGPRGGRATGAPRGEVRGSGGRR
ncbi:DUF948 domain-containing protein [Bailinhaonella thermotolerans]|uniref:DUF948 domain-containing protein n=1 Tax=Bailinhaonella thermotolerans TaxID=1070861 RepID=A0A3A4B5Y3_9ACTN|nr:DUF948 domain-containing protein [Bailinhaonella thermotolerans]RJL33967.1 DUF948 domain-containing protein [Bailinhaonella thermotolerans]